MIPAPVDLLRGLERLGRRGFQQVAPDRLSLLSFLPSHSPDAAAAELERCATLGHRGAIIDVFEMDLADRRGIASGPPEDTGLPISLHIKAGSWSGLSYQIGKWQAAAFATIMPLQLDEILATLIFSGALERHPRATGGAGGVGDQLAAVLPRTRRHGVERPQGRLDYAPELSPSELFRRQPTQRSRRSASPSRSPCWVPIGACGHPTIRTPTARSRIS